MRNLSSSASKRIKQTETLTSASKNAVFHELENSDRFKKVTPRCLAMSPHNCGIRIAFEFFPTNLRVLMRESLSVNYNLPYQLAKIMSQFESKGYLLREFRLQKFLARPSKLKAN